MRAALHEVRAMKAIAAIRGVQAGEARLASARADGKQRAAEVRLENARAAVRAIEQGWAAAVAAAGFDPMLSRSWLHALDTCRSEEQVLDEAAAQATQDAAQNRRALMEAQARFDVSDAEARSGARAVARRREEAGLAAVEDRINGRRRRS